MGGSSDHLLDELAVTGSVDDVDVVLGSLELPAFSLLRMITLQIKL